jgi:hypothetical protein
VTDGLTSLLMVLGALACFFIAYRFGEPRR